jgi:hypothetical protein
MRLLAAGVLNLLLVAVAGAGPPPERARADGDGRPAAAGTEPPCAAKTRGRYSEEPSKACESLRALAQQTLQRPRPAQRLFVEAYFMRSLVAAHELLRQTAPDQVDEQAARACIERAVAFADTMVAIQSYRGLWPLGYPAVWYADMGAAAAIFPAVEPYVDEERLKRYEAAVEKFLNELARLKMLHADGSVGMGRDLIDDPLRGPRRPSPEPYLVSSALVGVEARAWLYRRTRRPELREQAIRSLDYTLSQICPDGFREPAGRREGSIRISSYVQEGWMAADQFLDDPRVIERLRRALPPHVAWLLESQRPDGTWEAPEDGSLSRTPPILVFLMWYDERCESRADVRAAVRRAGAGLRDRLYADSNGTSPPTDHSEVLHALSGRALAALARDRFVF